MQKRFKLCQRSNLKSILAPTLHQLFIIEKYVKIRSKIRKSPCYFLRSRGQKIKNTTKIEQKILFLFAFLVSFFTVLLSQKLSHTINIWFNFRSLCEKMIYLCTYFATKIWSKIWSIFFLTVARPFHRMDFKWKKYGGTGIISEKTEAL